MYTLQAMEVDEKPTEEYSDIGGLDKQIQEVYLNSDESCLKQILTACFVHCSLWRPSFSL
jgi:hypothetical protein